MSKTWTRTQLLAKTVKDGDCRIWKGGYDTNGGPYVHHNGKRVPVRKLMLELAGQQIPDGHFVGRTLDCQHMGCICDAHAAVRTRSDHMQAVSLRQVQTAKSKINRRIAARKRGKLTTEQAREIRTSTSKLRELSAKYGISMQTASRIRRGVMWQESTSPFAGLGV